MGRGSSGKAENGYAAVKMPTLTGTDKQVKWANDIRTKAVDTAKDWTDYRVKMSDYGPPQLKGTARDALYDTQASAQSTKEAAREFLNALSKATDASAIIKIKDKLTMNAVRGAIQNRAWAIDKQKKRGKFK